MKKLKKICETIRFQFWENCSYYFKEYALRVWEVLRIDCRLMKKDYWNCWMECSEKELIFQTLFIQDIAHYSIKHLWRKEALTEAMENIKKQINYENPTWWIYKYLQIKD